MEEYKEGIKLYSKEELIAAVGNDNEDDHGKGKDVIEVDEKGTKLTTSWFIL